jgi:haloacetate dehalogenase
MHAMCEDYRAGASIDLEHDRADRAAGRKLDCPLLALWGRMGRLERHFDVLATWQEAAVDVCGHGLACGHFLPEEKPDETLTALLAFIAPM